MNLKKNETPVNYIDLLDLKTEKLLQNGNVNIILQDDIWDNDVLLLRGGRYLTASLINKLINFGVKRINVDVIEKNIEELTTADSIKDFTAGQCALIVENNMINASWLVRHLVDVGFEAKNIFITADYNAINQYFRVKKINFIFTSHAIYEKCKKCIDKYSHLRDVHAFVTTENITKIKPDSSSTVNFIDKSNCPDDFKNSVKQALNANFLYFYSAETLAS